MRCWQCHAPCREAPAENAFLVSRFWWLQAFPGSWPHHSRLCLCLCTPFSMCMSQNSFRLLQFRPTKEIQGKLPLLEGDVHRFRALRHRHVWGHHSAQCSRLCPILVRCGVTGMLFHCQQSIGLYDHFGKLV